MRVFDKTSNIPTERQKEELSFTVQTIDCIACSPLFRTHLKKIDGVLEVKELPITNKIIVAFDRSKLDREHLSSEIQEIAKKAGLAGKIIFVR